MYIDKYDIDLQFSDFTPVDHHWHKPFSYYEGDLLYDRRDDLGLLIGLLKDQRWDTDCPFGYGISDEFRGIQRVIFFRDSSSFEDAFDYLCRDMTEKGILEPDMYRCLACGAEFPSTDLKQITVMEDYGDVGCAVCPSCQTIEYDGMELFVEI